MLRQFQKIRIIAGTYITAKRLIYRGQDKISEDGDTGSAPVLVLERPVKQKVHIEKKTDDGEILEISGSRSI